MAQDRKKEIMRVATPLSLSIVILLGFFSGFFNTLDAIILVSTLSVAYYDYHTAKTSSWLSFFIMIMGMGVVFFWLKFLIPTFENKSISSGIYYLLDFSLLLICFIGAFFILKGLDFLSTNKNKAVRPLGGVLKSTLVCLSVILLISASNLITESFIQKEFRNSKVAHIMTIFLPEIKLGKKINISFGKFGLKIEK